MADKMRLEAEEESKSTREKVVSKAREEADEIIAKAQNSKDKIRKEIQAEFDVKIIGYGMEILAEILSQEAKSSLNDILIEEFLTSLENVDMSRIDQGVKSVDVFTLTEMDAKVKDKLASIIKKKLNREVVVNASIDSDIGGGVLLKFGSMALDGTIKNLIKEKGLILQAEATSEL